MATRDLATNSQRAFNDADKIISYTSTELIKSYERALIDVRAKVVQLYEIYMPAGELTTAQATQFLRLSNIEANIVEIMTPYLEANKELLKDMSVVSFDSGYFNSAWAIDQASGVSLQWGLISDSAVRAAAGIGGTLNELQGLLTEKEIAQHTKVLTEAFETYSKDSQKWISEEIRQGIIKGESIPKITKRIKDSGIGKSLRSAELISRTEVLRATGIGQQIGYSQAIDQGVNVNQIWHAVLDDRTRPSHISADGTIMDNTTGLFDLPWGQYPGARRSGIAAEDINCRCQVRGVVEGYSPEVRRIRGEGLQPYQSASSWIADKGFTVNRYGQKYDFNVAARAKGVKGKIKVNLINSNIDFGYPKGKFNNLVANIRPEARAIIAKYPKPNNIRINNRGAYYLPNKKDLYTDNSPKTFNHEYGHHLDHNVLPSKNGITQNISLTKEFREAYDIDREVYSNRKISDLTKTIKDSGYNTKTKEGSAISDIIDSFKNGQLHDKGFMSGHGKRYYNMPNKKQIETFANIYQMWATEEEWNKAIKFFPNITNAFEKIMEGL